MKGKTEEEDVGRVPAVWGRAPGGALKQVLQGHIAELGIFAGEGGVVLMGMGDGWDLRRGVSEVARCEIVRCEV